MGWPASKRRAISVKGRLKDAATATVRLSAARTDVVINRISASPVIHAIIMLPRK